MATGYERSLLTAALSLFCTFGVCGTAMTAFVARCSTQLSDGPDISINCTANRPVDSVRCFDSGVELPCIFPMRLLTGPGSATVMVVFRDYDGNTAASGGVVTYDMGGLHPRLDSTASLVQFNPSIYTVSEHETAVILSAERVGNTSLSLRVDFDTSNGTATGGRDFVAVSGSFNFLPSETHKNISIAIHGDGIVEEMEYFFVQLYVSGGLQTNVILGAANRSVVNITDSGQREPSMSRCPAGTDPIWDVLWMNTPAGERDMQSCSRSEEIGTASRYCDENGSWGEPNVLECESTEFRAIRLEAERIFASNATLEEVLVQVSALMARLNASTALANETMQSLLPRDLNTTNSILSNTITLLENSTAIGFNTTNVETQEVIIDIFNNVLSVSNLEGWQSLQTVDAGSQFLLSNVERFGLYVANSEDNTSTILSRPNIVLSAVQYGLESTTPVTFPTPEDLVNISFQNLSAAAITIPSELLRERLQDGRKTVPVVNILFQNLGRFLPEEISNNSRAVSVVLSSQVAFQSSSLDLRENPITLSFTFDEQRAVSQDTLHCVFWNFSEPIGNGGWISDGVRTMGNYEHSQGRTRVQCESTHLTSFAVLVDVTGEHSHLEALRVVSYIGCAISLGCLAIAIVFYLFQRKKLFTPNLIRFIHLNLAISLFLAYLTFVAGVELARDHKVACIVVAALLHYLFLAAFCWMLCEGVMIFLMLVMVFSTLSKRWWFFLLLGYGFPVLFVVIGLAVRHEYYGVKDGEGHLLFCWLSTEKGVIWAFVAPMLAIITINLVFLCLAVWKVLQMKRNQVVGKKNEPVIIAVSLLKATIVLLPLLGLTWVFGLLAVNQNTIVFAWIFTILNSFQGAGIFFFHVIKDKMVWPKLTSKLSVCHHMVTMKTSSANDYTVSSVKQGSSAKEKEVQEPAQVNTGKVDK